jgi:hypothetical protein
VGPRCTHIVEVGLVEGIGAEFRDVGAGNKRPSHAGEYDAGDAAIAGDIVESGQQPSA